jgi:hypothetical protein
MLLHDLRTVHSARLYLATFLPLAGGDELLYRELNDRLPPLYLVKGWNAGREIKSTMTTAGVLAYILSPSKLGGHTLDLGQSHAKIARHCMLLLAERPKPGSSDLDQTYFFRLQFNIKPFESFVYFRKLKLDGYRANGGEDPLGAEEYAERFWTTHLCHSTPNNLNALQDLKAFGVHDVDLAEATEVVEWLKVRTAFSRCSLI